MKMIKSFLVGTIFTLLTFTEVSAAAFQCEVEVEKLLVYRDGSVNVLHSGRGDFTYICNLATKRENVSVTTCAVWVSLLQQIKKNKGKAMFYYAGEGSCATIATYGNAPVPVYIGDNNSY